MSQPVTANQPAQTERDEMIKRGRAFAKWLQDGKRKIANGLTPAYVRIHHKKPFAFDEYEMRRAIEEGLV